MLTDIEFHQFYKLIPINLRVEENICYFELREYTTFQIKNMSIGKTKHQQKQSYKKERSIIVESNRKSDVGDAVYADEIFYKLLSVAA